MNAAACQAIVLAGERDGGNPLATALGLRAGVLVDLNGRSCLGRVLDALRASDSISGGLVAGPTAAVRQREEALQNLLATGDFAWVEPGSGPAASALAAFELCAHHPVLITSGDHGLLTPAIVDEFCVAAASIDADLVIGLVPYRDVMGAYPGTRRTRLRFRDGQWCGSNLFLARTRAAAAAFGFWQRLEDARKRPWRIASRLGITTLLRYVLRLGTTADAFASLSNRSGVVIRHLPVPHPRAAIDVDSLADLQLAREILADD